MHASNTPPPARVRLVHVLAPVALSVGLVVGGYSLLTGLADDIASTVKPLPQESTAPASDPLATPVAAHSIAAN